MKNIIIGTAGHIDHGKTTLIKALTGADTDRLIEEKKRGISIDLGFAQFQLPGGNVAGIVDVPGHERFVKNMLAGATGMDLVLLVVAADDGVMPQTKEHLAIANLLGVKKAVVAVTKADLVDDDWLDLVIEDIKGVLKGTSFADSPIIPVSAIKKTGIEDLIKEVDRVAREVTEKDLNSPYRLPIDRVFSLKGAGTVVTGTLWSGEMSVEEQVVILPSGLNARVRSLQVHDKPVETAYAGQRVAVNLAGLNREDVKRGDVILPLGYLKPTSIFDAKFHLLTDAPKSLKNRTRVRIYHATHEVLGRIIFLNKDELKPGESDFVQFNLEAPIVPRYGDRYVVRQYSPVYTIGGGRIIDGHPRKHKRFRPDVISKLEILEGGNLKEIAGLIFKESSTTPMTKDDIIVHYEFSRDELDVILELFLKEGKLLSLRVGDNAFYIFKEGYEKLKMATLDYLKKHHVENPLSPGVKKDVIRAQVMPHLSFKQADAILGELNASKSVVLEGDIVRHFEVKTELSGEQKGELEKVLSKLKEGKFAPLTLNELENNLNISKDELREYLRILTSKGDVVRIKHDIFYYSDAINEIKDELISFLKKNKKMGPAEFKDLLGVTRKHALPLLEYFDSQKITRRVGSDRVLR
ncbi:selenocysteine-specific translation elongation factor [Candidatus Oleimmundimicrobium sp.]|uniref:selenocysteine-specific translation elongation factor n=1 Tax=Candidatus Oleimmundimicrobium sp. TaxID=3060597 RepID=UPI002724E4EF|nr:selenocysteine-specific translation elongation factor [Candidatus Oleimmundimicrobium sp.]MDO8885641.1 selenocysteine-specific translation elongation factor [Candidatus Oleimmundimicrobium sp.]